MLSCEVQAVGLKEAGQARLEEELDWRRVTPPPDVREHVPDMEPDSVCTLPPLLTLLRDARAVLDLTGEDRYEELR